MHISGVKLTVNILLIVKQSERDEESESLLGKSTERASIAFTARSDTCPEVAVCCIGFVTSAFASVNIQQRV